MLPIYNAISFEGTIDKGSRTNPWVMKVRVGSDVKDFVVKMFESVEIQSRDSVSNEVFGNILARQFDLPTPEAALINIDYNVLKTIKNKDVLLGYHEKDSRIKFGTEYLRGYIQMQPSRYTAAEAKQMIHIDDLFGYDNLIRNRDRKKMVRPNLIVKKQIGFLIDHELCFDVTEETFKELEDKSWNTIYYKNHLVYDYLKDGFSKNKLDYFATFNENLKHLDLKLFDSCCKQLAHHGHVSPRHQMIRNYLVKMKSNSHNFATLLSAIVQ